MFQSIGRGFGFVGQAIAMVRKDGDLIKPSLMGLVVGAVVAVLGGLPIAAVAILGGDSDLARYLVYGMSAVLIFVQYAVAYTFSGMTCYLVYGFLAEGDGRMDKAWDVVKRDFLDLLSLAAVSALVKLVENSLRGRDRRGRSNPFGVMLANALDALWTTATYFILPIMVIEDLSLWPAAKRATEIVKKNLLMVAVTEIGVGWVMGLFTFLVVVVSIGLGLALFILLANLSELAAILLAVLVAGTLIALGSALNSYVMTAYHTCMFLWARDAEKAVAAGRPAQSVAAPAPVAALLAR